MAVGLASIRATRMSIDAVDRLRAGRGTIVEVHRLAAYVADGRREDLITIALDEVGGVPGGIGLGGCDDIRTLGIWRGDRVEQVAGSSERLVAIGPALLIDLGGAAPWSPALPPRARLALPGPAGD